MGAAETILHTPTNLQFPTTLLALPMPET